MTYYFKTSLASILYFVFLSDMKTIFDQFDKDGNGTITFNELTDFLDKLNIKSSPDCIQSLFKAMDKDGMFWFLTGSS